jgi:hypothetical protein
VHRVEVELAVEVHGDDAVAALFAFVIMDLSRRLLPHGSGPAYELNTRTLTTDTGVSAAAFADLQK